MPGLVFRLQKPQAPKRSKAGPDLGPLDELWLGEFPELDRTYWNPESMVQDGEGSRSLALSLSLSGSFPS